MGYSYSMTSLAKLVYQFLLEVLRFASVFVRVKPKRSRKFLRGLYGRRLSCRKLLKWAENVRGHNVLTFWIHASSVGELIQAKSVAQGLRKRLGNIHIVFTFFSASAEKMAANFPSEVSGYLPWDQSRKMAVLLDALSPSALLFTQREVWPNLNDQAIIRGIPTVMIAGTLSEDSKKLKWPWRLFSNIMFRQICSIGAISENDGKRFEELGVDKDRIQLTGDPAVDVAYDRANSLTSEQCNLDCIKNWGGSLIVAGSTYGADEEMLLHALTDIKKVRPETRMAIVPHEVFPTNIRKSIRRCADRGFEVVKFSDLSNDPETLGDVLVVDVMGVLPDLYKLSRIAYVGGGFGDKGLHSVLEPAAAGVPVLFGPKYKNSEAASSLLEGGAGRVVSDSVIMVHVIEDYFLDEARLLKAGRNALGYVERNRGATDKTVDLICNVLRTFNR